jgi:hypothetical protein
MPKSKENPKWLLDLTAQLQNKEKAKQSEENVVV